MTLGASRGPRSLPRNRNDPLITLSLQITDAVERFSLPSNGSEEAPEAMDVTLTPYLAPPPIWLIGRNQRMPRRPRRPADRTIATAAS